MRRRCLPGPGACTQTDSAPAPSPEAASTLEPAPAAATPADPPSALGLGLGASRGKRLGTPTAPGVASFRATSQQPFFSYLASTTATDAVVADGTHLRLSPQASWFWSPLGLLAEYASSAQEVKRGTERTRLRHQSWQATAAFVLFGGNASAEGVKPTRPLSLSEGT